MSRTYLVECYWPGVTEQAYAETVTRAGRAARELRGSGLDVRFLDSLLVPADEAVFYRFAGDSAASVERACRLAALPFERILEYVDADEPPGKSQDDRAHRPPP